METGTRSFLFLLMLWIGCGQGMPTGNQTDGTLYSGVENRVSFDSLNCSDLYIKVMNGYCRCIEDQYAVVRPDTVGKVLVDVIGPNNAKSTFKYISKQVPDPQAHLFPIRSPHWGQGTYQGIVLKAYGGPDFESEVHYEIISLLAHYMKNDVIVESTEYYGGLFYGELYKRVNNLINGEGAYNRITIDSIQFKYPDGTIGMTDNALNIELK